MRLFADRLGPKLNVFLLGFVLVLGLTTAALIIYGFQRTQNEATSSSRAGLEEEGKETLSDLSAAYAQNGQAQLETTAGFAQQAARYMLDANSREPAAAFDPATLITTENGVIHDARADRRTDLFLPPGTSVTEAARRDIEESAVLDDLFPTLIQGFTGYTRSPNFEAVAIYFQSVNNVTRMFPPFGEIAGLETGIAPDLQAVTDAVGPAQNPGRATYWSAPYEDAAGRGYVITALVPVYDGDEYRGVMGVDLSIDRLIAQIDAIRPTKSGYAFYVDRDGMLLPTSRAPEIQAEIDDPRNEAFANVVAGMRNGRSAVEVAEVRDRELFVAYVPLTGVGGVFGLAAPVEEVTEQAALVDAAIDEGGRNTLIFTLVAIAAILAVGLAVAAWLSRRLILQPIAEVVGGTRAIAAGDLEARIPVRSGDELGTLADSFNTMSGVLNERTEALRASEAEMRALFQAMPDVVVRLNREGRYLSIAPTSPSEQLSQTQRIVGRTVYDTYPAEQAERMMEPVRRAFETGQPQAVEFRGAGTDDTERWFAASISPMSDDEVLVVSRDITARREQEKELREREEQYRSTFESTSDGLIITRIEDGDVVEVNPAMAEMHGYRREEMLHMHPTRFIHPDDHHLFASYIETVAAGGEYRCRARDIRKDGSELHVEVLGTPVSYSGKRHILGVVRDITATIEGERILEERVENRTRELSALLHTSQAVASTLDIKQVASAILEELASVAEYTGATLLTLDGDDLVIIDSFGPYRDEVVSGPTARFPRNAIPRAFWRTMDDGAPVIIDDVRGDSELAESYRSVFRPFLDLPSFRTIRSWVAVPMISKGAIVGMLTAAHNEPGHFTPERANLIVTGAAQAAVAMDNARLFEQAQDRTRELGSLLDVSRSIASKLTFDELVETIIAQTNALFETTAVSVNLIDQRGIATHLGSNNPLFTQLGITRGFRYSMRPYGEIFAAAKRNEPVLIDDVRADEPMALAYRNAVGGEIDRAFSMVRAWMAVPMTSQGNLIGLLFIANDQPGAYVDADLALAHAVANQAAIAIDNARLFEETQERTRELQTLLDVSTNVASTIDLKSLVDVIVEQVGAVAEYDRASVLILEDDGSALRVMTLRRRGDTAPVGALPDTRFPVDEAPLMWREFNAGRTVIIDDVRDESDELAGDYRASAAPRTDPKLEHTRSWMAVPLIAKERVIGIIALSSALVGGYTRRQGQLVSSIATQAAAAMENARLFAETQERTSELGTLLDVSKHVASTIELQPLLDTILEQVRAVAPYYRGAFLIRDGEDLVVSAVGMSGDTVDAASQGQIGARFSAGAGDRLWARVSSGASMIIDDVHGDTPEARWFRAALGADIEVALPGIRSWMGIPLLAKDQPLGMLALASDEPEFYTEQHARLARAVADQAGVAIENARLFAQTEERTRELSTLLDVARNVAATIELAPLFDLVLEQVRFVAPYDGGSIMLLHEDRVRIEAESRDVSTIGLEFPVAGNLLWEHVSTGAVVIVDDVRGDSPEAAAWRATAGPLLETRYALVRSWLGVPIMLGDRILGLLALSGHEEGRFNEQHARLARAVADQAAVAIENARLYTETEQQNRESAALLEISKSLTSTLELTSLVRVILVQLGNVVDYTGSSVVIVNRNEDLEILSSRIIEPPNTPESSGIRFPLRRDSRTWQFLESGQTVVIDDIRSDDVLAREYRATIGDAIHTDSFRLIQSWMAVPLAIKDRLIGILTMSRTEQGYFKDEHVRVASAVGRQAAVAIENARLYQEAELRTRELAALLDVSKDITSTLDREELVRGILKQLRTIVEYNGASIIVREGDELVILDHDRDARAASFDIRSRFPVQTAAGLWSVMESGRELITADVQASPADEATFRNATGDLLDTALSYVHSLMSVPLIVRDRAIGFVMMSHMQPNFFTQDHARLVRAAADQAALALENARLFEEARQRALETEALLRADAELYRSLSLDDVFQALCDVAVDVLGVGKTMVTTIDDEEGRYTIRASRNIAQSSLDEMMAIRRQTPRKALAQMREPLVNADARSEIPEMLRVFEEENVVSTIDIPIRMDGKVRGDFSIAHTHSYAPTPAELRLYQALADRASVAIQNAELYERAQQVASLEERQRLARELHDSVSQALYGIALGARTARTQLDREPAAAVEPMEYVLQLAEAGLAEMRALIFELRPESLQTEGLVAAIEKQVASTRSRYSLDVRADLGAEPDTKIDVKEALYRVAQEALHNIVKHAHAEHVVVSLQATNGSIALRVQDDGRGFDPQGSYPGHVGLHSMRERIDKLHGTIKIESEPGEGTRVDVWVPVDGV